MPVCMHLNKDKIAIVDEEDFEFLSHFRWHAKKPSNSNCWYAYSYQKTRPKTISMHREILKHHGILKDKTSVDHIDGNGLNNQKSNLRLATASQQISNRGMHKNNKCGFKGVSTHGNKFRATICFNKHWIYLGAFETAIEAANAYDKKAFELFGEFAKLNFTKEK